MGKVLYTAFNENGNQESGFINVSSNKEALVKLKEDGLVEIALHGDAALGFERGDLSWMSAGDIEKTAKLEAQWQKGSSFFSYFAAVMKEASLTLVIGLGMAFYGYHDSSVMWTASGVILASLFPFLGLWNYRLISTHNALLKAIAFGEWDKVEDLSRRLSQETKDINVIIEADTMQASYYAQKKDMDTAVKLLLPHKEHLELQSPGMFENKIALLYHTAGEYDKFVDKMREAARISNQDFLRGDLAMAEARLGSLEVAETEIEKIDVEAMAVYAVPFIHYTKGLIAYKKSNFKIAKEELLSAYGGALEYSENPAAWTTIAMITGTLALVMYDMDEREKAEELLSDGVIKVLKVHADRPFMKALKERFPEHFES